MKKWLRIIIIPGFLLILSLAGAYVLAKEGIILPNNPSTERYPVRGVDVSSYQGEIDWAAISAQDIDFAFIKATEGSGWQDPYFTQNWNESEGLLLRGAYHFFSFESSGETQAQNFIDTVPNEANALPPVVDVEFYQAGQEPLSKEETHKILIPLLDALEAHYGKRPILYATQKSYEWYLEGTFEDYPLWIRNVITAPPMKDWLFWQYSSKGRLDGYEGKEKFIDLNVFAGTMDELLALTETSAH